MLERDRDREREGNEEREQLLRGVTTGCFFLCCGALFLHLTLRCDGDDDDDGDSDVFIAKNICAARRALSRALQGTSSSMNVEKNNSEQRKLRTLYKPTERGRTTLYRDRDHKRD